MTVLKICEDCEMIVKGGKVNFMKIYCDGLKKIGTGLVL